MLWYKNVDFHYVDIGTYVLIHAVEFDSKQIKRTIGIQKKIYIDLDIDIYMYIVQFKLRVLANHRYLPHSP